MGSGSVHEYSGTHEDGSPWQTVKKWFGYTIHLLVDSHYELPVSFSVTRANASEVVEAHQVLDRLEEQHPGWWSGVRSWQPIGPTTMGS